ncbi:B12-binding domain-containing protein [Streptomyces sp. NPDC047079]|uniref:B12-binding domain-containing protein n=1 Tax=Streptomyces sp. NPDC047079 TaxID=3154607 RepID=UPI0033E28830
MTTTPVRSAATAGPDVLRDRLWRAVRAGDEHTACAAVPAALRDGTGMEAAVPDPLAPVQDGVGTVWAAGRLTVAQEHAVTAMHDRVIAAPALHHEHRGEPPGRARTTVACGDGAWHVLPARLLAEVLDDACLFVAFIRCTADVVTARGVPARRARRRSFSRPGWESSRGLVVFSARRTTP